MGWQNIGQLPSFYGSDISRWTRVIGDGLRSQPAGARRSVDIAATELNRVLELGHPEHVRTA
jgi:hypothetical protein